MIRAAPAALLLCCTAFANGVLTFGDPDCLGQSCFGPTDPTTGATLQGLGDGTATFATVSFFHSFPFLPGAGDFAGTDQIYVGSSQTGAHDGYATSPQRINAPEILILDYSSLVPFGQFVTSLTIGMAADDFQVVTFGQAFVATVNGILQPDLTHFMNSFDGGGPQVKFFTVGLSTALDTPSHTLTLNIDQQGDGGDGWAIDFLTIGVTTSATPEPATFGLMLASAALLIYRRARRS